ncbi:hypothetical protein NDU88_000696 [Pleurodeles waltl]|uniref:Secreted protein n=1 Tax=Pleurodeles waltl TaxID=8319 RepID=A0AAV7MJL9_PLEWA|nr:hypothetical protein NDU88_000696 [Pleurodeles waltl]
MCAHGYVMLCCVVLCYAKGCLEGLGLDQSRGAAHRISASPLPRITTGAMWGVQHVCTRVCHAVLCYAMLKDAWRGWDWTRARGGASDLSTTTATDHHWCYVGGPACVHTGCLEGLGLDQSRGAVHRISASPLPRITTGAMWGVQHVCTRGYRWLGLDQSHGWYLTAQYRRCHCSAVIRYGDR